MRFNVCGQKLQFREVVEVPDEFPKLKKKLWLNLLVKITARIYEKAVCQINLKVVILSQ